MIVLFVQLNPSRSGFAKPYDSTIGVPEWISLSIFILVMSSALALFIWLRTVKRKEAKLQEEILKRPDRPHRPQ